MMSQSYQQSSHRRVKGTHTIRRFHGIGIGLGFLMLLPYLSHGWIQILSPARQQNNNFAARSITFDTVSSTGRRPVHWNTMRITAVVVSMNSGNVESKGGIQTIDLSTGLLDSNHDVVGQELADSIVRWLDSEWMPQEVHIRMAMSAKNSYVQCRESGTSDVMDIMMQISTDLDADWMQLYDADAFVNAWDVGNYAADYLTKKSGNEGCACSSELF
jgi:hypothetical protein